MKAVVCARTGPPEVLEIRELERPVPGDQELLICVRAATVTYGDTVLRGMRFPLSTVFWLLAPLLGVQRPRNGIPGSELAGDVEAVGRGVRAFHPGEPVFACSSHFGANAEYVCLPEDGVVAAKPSNMTYAQAAAVPIGGLTALHFLRQAGAQSGQQVLVYGASGSVGSYAVQLARGFGAEVHAVCSTANLEWVQGLGAARVIDYTREDFAASGDRYDVVFDAVGKASQERCRQALAPGGSYVTVKRGTPKNRARDLVFLRDWIEAGKLRAIVDRTYALEQAVEAHRYVEQGHKKGNVVLTVA